MKPRRQPNRVCQVIGFLAVFGVVWSGDMQPSASQPSKRPFDAFPGIIVSCAPTPAITWTVEACAEVLADVQRRARALGMPTYIWSAEAAATHGGNAPPFDADRALKLGLGFALAGDKQNRIRMTLNSSYLWQPTEKEVPNAVPGQRIPMNFRVQSAITNERGTRRDIMQAAKALLDNFFQYGEGRLPPEKPPAPSR